MDREVEVTHPRAHSLWGQAFAHGVSWSSAKGLTRLEPRCLLDCASSDAWVLLQAHVVVGRTQFPGVED